jgi:hypothetical protein
MSMLYGDAFEKEVILNVSVDSDEFLMSASSFKISSFNSFCI